MEKAGTSGRALKIVGPGPGICRVARRLAFRVQGL